MIQSNPSGSFLKCAAIALLRVMTLLGITLFLVSCATNSKEDALKNTDYKGDRNGITIDITASDKLNLASNLPHTLALGVIQLNSSQASLALSKNSIELAALLAGIPSTNSAVTAINRYVIQPGAIDTVTIGRVQNTQVIIVYAGFFNAALDKCVRIYQIPVKITSKGWIEPTYSGNPAPLNLTLNLDETEIRSLTIVDPNEDKSNVRPAIKNPVLNGGEPNPNAPLPKVMEL
jgi:hypothetical protein